MSHGEEAPDPKGIFPFTPYANAVSSRIKIPNYFNDIISNGEGGSR
ncbi:hypothetical protein BSNK01_29490 [Bacillaceae bacterium]